ncbi:MAG: anthranilate phosphoribosyltransferase [Desulfohalobiaceae bacterium]|nr:anthranilate phosphoribosyltransferase [Desulfohalobiaceae bacterium]
MSINTCLHKLAAGKDLLFEEAGTCFQGLFGGDLALAQSGALLMGLKVKGETPDELRAAVLAALKQARIIRRAETKIIDTCGTGGDGRGSFNCSTAVALYLADMGYKVAKHGNRAVSGSCGSADVMESLQIPFARDEDQALAGLKKSNLSFLFAPDFHPAFARISPIRRELGFPTLFNLLGPLLNPARPTHQLLGVGKSEHLGLIAETLAGSGIKRAAVVHGGGGFDELTPCGVSEVVFVFGSSCRRTLIDPRRYHVQDCSPERLCFPGKDPALQVMRQVLKGQGPEEVLDMVGLNLGLALCLLEDEQEIYDCMSRGLNRVRQGVDLGRYACTA